jgi:hypothetical protein
MVHVSQMKNALAKPARYDVDHSTLAVPPEGLVPAHGQGKTGFAPQQRCWSSRPGRT